MSNAALIQENELESKALSLPAQAKAIKIVDQASYNAAARMKLGLVDLEKQIVDHHAPIKSAAHKAHLAACAAEKKLLDPTREALAIVNRSLAVWEREQEQIRLEEQRRKDAEVAEANRRARQEAEAAERRVREEAQKIKEEEEAVLRAALEAEAAGAPPEAVNAIINTPIPEPVIAPAPDPKPIPRTVVAPTFRRVAGAAPREKNYRAEITDIKVLCRAVADGSAAPECVEGNMTYLNKRARDDKDKLSIPGVKAVKDEW